MTETVSEGLSLEEAIKQRDQAERALWEIRCELWAVAIDGDFSKALQSANPADNACLQRAYEITKDFVASREIQRFSRA